MPCASCALEPEKGTLSEQRVVPQQPLWLPCQRASWEPLSLQHVNAVPESFPKQTVAMGQRIPSRMGTSGKEGLDWPNRWRKVAPCPLGAVRNQTKFGLWDGTSCFLRPPEPCLGRAALWAGRSLWLGDMALQSCHHLQERLLGRQCQAWKRHPGWGLCWHGCGFQSSWF